MVSCNAVTSIGLILEECKGESEWTIIIASEFGLVFLKSALGVI